MIMYEYSCSKCNTIYVVYQKITEKKLDSFYCPVCSKIMPMKRLVGSSGFVLAGLGWADSGYQKGESNGIKSG